MKRSAKSKQAAAPVTITPSVVRILKVATCPNLSGKSNLTYQIGITQESEIAIRVVGNDSSGFFSPEWVLFNAIQEAMSNWNWPLTSTSITPLFKGKSANSSGFLFAALFAEGVVERHAENPRIYQLCDPAPFVAKINALMASDTDIKVDHIPPGRKTVSPSKKQRASKSNPQPSQPEFIQG